MAAGSPSLRWLAERIRRRSADTLGSAPRGNPGRALRGTGKSSIDDKLKGDSLPSLEWLHLFVDACAAWSRSHGSGLTDAMVDRNVWFRRLAEMLKELELDRHNDIRSADASERLRMLAVPRRLPPTAPYFVGRDTELAALTAALNDTGGAPAAPGVAVISGLPGSGKSSLAVWWAHLVADRFPAGQLYLDLRQPDGTPLRPGQAARALLFQLGERPAASDDEQAEALRGRLAGQQVLIVLDNAESADQILPLLPAARESFVVVTGRSALDRLIEDTAAQAVRVEPFTSAQARVLLVERLGEKVVAADPAATGTVVTGCAGLPLAVNVAAALVERNRESSLRRLADAVTSAQQRLGAGRGAQVEQIFRLSYADLEPEAARVFRLLGVHPGPFVTQGVVASLAATAVREAGRVIGSLVDRHLLEERQSGRYGLHDLLRENAMVLADAEETAAERRDAIARAVDFYLHNAHRAAMAWDPQRDPLILPPAAPDVPVERVAGDAEGLDWLRRHHLSVMRMIPIAVDLGFDTHAWQLAWTMSDFLNRQGYWHDLATAVEHGLVAARRCGDERAEARMRRLLGRTYALLDRLDDSDTHLEAALRLWTAADDHAGRAHTYIDLSRNAGARKLYSHGAELARRAAECYAAAGNAAGEANALNAVGWYASLGGAHEQALAVCQEALLRNRAAGDRSGEAATLDSIGAAHLELGDLRSAEANLVAAAALFAETGDPGEQAGSLRRLAAVHLEAARRALRQAVELFEGVGAQSAAREARSTLDRLC